MARTYENWRTSSYTNPDGECVEVAQAADGTVAIRDSKDRQGPILEFTQPAIAELLTQIRAKSRS